VPEWYFLPFYAMLRSVPDNFIDVFGILPIIISAKAAGVVVIFGSIILLIFLPWLDTSKVRSANYRPVFRWAFWLFFLDCIVLGYVGGQAPEGAMLTIGRVATFWYFVHLLVVVPFLGKYERTLPLPESISAAVTAKESK
jgi:quinol-cytochrome oxidoreductase complex cytochrome b subunit